MVSHGKKLATLPGLFKPNPIAVDDQQLYICDGVTVHIYSLEDFTRKATFGKPGEGPQEFLHNPSAPASIMIAAFPEYLLVGSRGKISFYSKDGKFIREQKVPGGQMFGIYQPIGNNFAGMGGSLGEDRSMALTINLYDADFKKIREIHKQSFMKKGMLSFPAVNPIFYARENRIIVPGGEEFAINILDAEGNKVTSISREYKRLKVGDDYKKGVHDFLKAMAKDRYELVKQMLTFRDTFPAIQAFFVEDGKIYIQTFMGKDGSDEFFIYDLNGKFLKRLFVPFKYLNPVIPSPFAIKNDTLYQLIENENEEEWELHAVEIK